MNKLKVLICSLLLACLAVGTIDGNAAAPRRKSAKTTSTRKKSARSGGSVTIATLANALNANSTRVTSLATLDKQLNWAEGIRTRITDKLSSSSKSAEKKNGKFVFNGTVEDLLKTDNLEELIHQESGSDDLEQKLQKYVDSQPRYSSNTAAMSEGAAIVASYIDFRTLCLINDILANTTSTAAKNAFKKCMVDMYAAMKAYNELWYLKNVMESGSGSFANLMEISVGQNTSKGANDMLFEILDCIKNKERKSSEGSYTAFNNLSGKFSYSGGSGSVTSSEFRTANNKFMTAGLGFLNSYSNWIKVYGSNSYLTDKPAVMFNRWARDLNS